MMLHLQNILNPAEIAQLLGSMATSTFVSGRELSGPNTPASKHNLQMPWGAPQAQALTSVVVGALERSKAFHAAAQPNRMSPPLFTHYREGMGYGEHLDAPIMHHPMGLLRSDLSATLFLSTPDEYEGGELVIHTGMGQTSMKCGAGDLLLYPSNALHRVSQVTRGVRSVVIFWIQSQVRDAAKRRILFDLAQVAVRMPPEMSAERQMLANTHANLLREWAEL